MTVQAQIVLEIETCHCPSPTCRRTVTLKIEHDGEGRWRWRDDNDGCRVEFRSIPKTWRIEHGDELTEEQLTAILPRLKERLWEQLDGVEAALRRFFPKDEQE